jgi:uncharacterized protein (TIRG00374 family)
VSLNGINIEISKFCYGARFRIFLPDDNLCCREQMIKLHLRGKPRYLWLLVRLAVVVVVLVIIATRLDLQTLTAQAKLLDYRYIGFGLLLWMIALVVASFRWKILIDVITPGASLISLLIFNFVGIFYGQFLPGSVTGDIVKGYYLARTQADKVGIMSSVLIDRFIGIGVNGLLGLMALMSNNVILNALGVSRRIATLLMVAIAVCLVIGYIMFRVIGRWESRFPRFFVPVYSSIRLYFQEPSALIKAALSSLVFFLVWSLALLCLAFAVGLNTLDFPTILLILAALNFAQFIPISINGWGVREGALIVLLSAYHVQAEKSLILSLLTVMPSLIVAVFGGIVVMLDYHYIGQQKSLAEGQLR